MKELLAGSIGIFGITLAIRMIGGFLPGFIVKKVHSLFVAAKTCPWWKEPSKPMRAKWLLATALLLEDEIPEPGTGKPIYEALGGKIAALTPILTGTGSKWATALEKAGDAVNLELDEEIKELAAPADAPKP